MQQTLARTILIATALALIGSSCKQADRLPVAPVKGRILYQGKPVVGVNVTFVQQGAPRHSFGTTDQEGYFTLTTFVPGDGAILGPNQVTVVLPAGPPEEVSGDVPDPEAYFRALRDAEEARDRVVKLPARYADPQTTDLVVTVTEGENHPVLELGD
ncbi:MAG: hypothetical protein ABIK89_03410 [Planctomycetota bacterium]